MRTIYAITLLVALLTAPLALLANAASVARYQKELSMTAHDEHCPHSSALGICGCYPGHAPAPTIISPVSETVLPRPIPLPSMQIRVPVFRAPDLIAATGFSPLTFHPPRG